MKHGWGEKGCREIQLLRVNVTNFDETTSATDWKGEKPQPELRGVVPAYDDCVDLLRRALTAVHAITLLLARLVIFSQKLW